MNAIDIVFIRHSDDKHTKVTLIAGNMLKPYIAHCWRIVAAALLLMVVVEVYLQHRLSASPDLYITHEDILRNAPAARVRLYPDDTVQVLRVHMAVLHKHIACSGSDLRAYDHSSVSVFHITVAYNDVLRRPSVGTTVLVASALYGYAVVAGMERAALDEHTVTALRVAAIAVRSLIPYLHVTYRKVLAEQRMDNPERRAQQGDALYEHVLPAYNIYKLWAQPVALSKDTLLQRSLLRDHFQKFTARAGVLAVLQSLFISQTVNTSHEPPAVVGSSAVYRSPAGDTHIPDILSIDAWRIVVAVHTLPACAHKRIEVCVEDKEQGRALLHDQVHPALQAYGTGLPLAGRDDDASAAFL